jgi:DNA-binding NarL/FixJ family response regulator
MLAGQPGIAVVAEERGTPHVRISDGPHDGRRGVPVLVLSDGSGVDEALDAGAAAMLWAHADPAALVAALRATAQGLTVLSPEFRDRLWGSLGDPEGADEDDPLPAVRLTQRECDVLRLMAEGASNKIIARRLGITPHTAKFHVSAIIAKLGAAGRTDAVARAMRLGLLMI